MNINFYSNRLLIGFLSSSKKLFAFITLVVLTSFAGSMVLRAQQLDWEINYPKMKSGLMTVGLDVDSILLRFTLSGANVATAKITVSLPAYYEFANTTTTNYVKSSSGHNSTVTYTTATPTGTSSAGTRKCVITFTGTGGTSLIVGKTVSLAIPVKAICGGSGNGDASIAVSGTVTPINSTQSVAMQSQTPSVRLMSDNPTLAYSSISEVKNVSLNMDAVNGSITAFKVTLKSDKYTTLSNFRLNGVSLTPILTKTLSATDTIYTLTFTAANAPTYLSGSKLDNNVQLLTFDASAKRCNTHTITTSTINSCPVTSNGPILTLSYNPIVGLPVFTSPSLTYLAADKSTVLNSTYDIPKDLSTAYYIKMPFQNTGTADAYDITASLGLFSMLYGYVDQTDIQYSIDGGAYKPITASMITGGNKLNSTNIKAAYNNINYYRVNISIPEVIPVGSTITFMYRCYAGAIYDFASNNVIDINGNRYTFGYYGTISSKNMCTDVAATATKSGYEADPIFKVTPVFESLPANGHYVETITLNTGGRALSSAAASYNELQFFVEMPDWMELDPTVSSAFYLANASGVAYTASGAVNDLGISAGIHTYSISYKAGSALNGAKLICKYRTTNCPTTSQNYTGKMHFWMNRQIGVNSATNPLLQKISQVYKDVMFLCKEDGIHLTGFTTVRTSRGLKDVDNNAIPDVTGGTATVSEVRNDTYLTDNTDQGYFSWNATMLGASSTTYKYLYLPVTMTGMTLTQLQTDSVNGTIYINGGAANSVTFKRINNSQFYVQYDASASPLKGGDLIEVRLPFKAITAREVYDFVSTECFVSNIVIATPFSTVGNPDKHGDDILGTTFGFFASRKTLSTANYTFSNNTTVSGVQINYFHTYTNSLIPSPYFTKEIRRTWYPIRLEWDFPAGYIQKSNLKVYFDTGDAISTATANRTKYLTPTLSGSTYSFDLASLFDPSYDGTNTLASGKWQLPDDRFIIRAYMDIQATKQAVKGYTYWNTRLVWKNVLNGSEVTTSNTQEGFYYNGPTVDLSFNTTKVYAYGDTLNIPIMNISNPSSQDINNLWLYVDGNVKDVFLTPVGASSPVVASGTGFEGRWVHVKNLFTAGSLEQYQLNFNYKGASSCTVLDTVKIYTVAGFDDPSWVAPTSLALDKSDINHVSTVKKPNIAAAAATIGGSISVSNTKLDYGVPYTLTAKINSSSGEGALKNPQMTITIPAGQNYISNSAQVEYPIGTKKPVSPAVETALLALNSDLTVDRTFVFSLKDALGYADNILIPGYLATNVSSYNQQALLTADFEPLCDSKLVGMKYKGVLEGYTSCGATAKNNGQIIYSSKMYSPNSGSYTFSVNSSITSGNRAFNQFRTNDELTVVIKKLTRLNDSISVNDFLQIDVPSCIDINGIAQYSGAVTASASVVSNIISGDTRTIKLTLPVNALNGLSVKDTPFTLKMPFVYTVDGQTWASDPINSIEANMVTGAAFGPCTNKETSTNSSPSLIDVAIVTMSQDIYKGCLNMLSSLMVTSTGYTGSWYSDAAASSLLVSGNTYNFTPAVQLPLTKVFYIKSIFGGINYGVLPVNLEMNPEVIATFSPTSQITCEGSPTVFTDLTTVGGVAANSANISAWSWNDITNSIQFAATQNPSYSFTDGLHNIMFSVISSDGCVSTSNGLVKVYKVPTVNITDIYYCAPGSASFAATTDVPSATFKWYDSSNNQVAGVVAGNFVTSGSTNMMYYVQAENNGCLSVKKSVNAYTYPSNSTWVGLTDMDWEKASNWSNGIPGECTDVIIKENLLGIYPDLSTLSVNAKCRAIKFEPATSIFGLEKLTYDSAMVMLDLKRDKWYMLTSPLKEMFSGDYYYEGVPVTQMKLFGYNTSASAGTNIQTVTGNWTNSFASLTEKLTPGEGFAYKIEQTEWHYPTGNSAATTDKTVTFPRTNADGTLKLTAIPYNGITGKLYPTLAQTMLKDKTKAYRFAMEDASNALTSINIPVKAGLNLIGNPLMSNLDFISLYTHNNTLISDYVQFWNGLSFGSITITGVVSGSTVDGLGLIIPPMKSFVVNALHDGVLVINLTDFTPTLTASLKSTRIIPNTLYIESNNGLARSSSSVIMNPEASNNPDNNDVNKLLSQLEEVPEVYTISGKKSLDINQFKTFPYVVPIGVKSGGVDSVKLNFKGVESFEGVEVKLINTATNETQDLKENCKYCLRTNGQTSEGSLFLEFRSASVVTGISSTNNVGAIQIYGSKDNSVKVLSSQDNKALEIFVYDPLGKLIAHKTALKNTCESLTINHPGKVFVVKVISEKGVESKKVILE